MATPIIISPAPGPPDVSGGQERDQERAQNDNHATTVRRDEGEGQAPAQPRVDSAPAPATAAREHENEDPDQLSRRRGDRQRRRLQRQQRPRPRPSDAHDSSGPRRRRRRAKNAGLRQKLRLVTDLLTCLDSLVFMELGAFYYLEVSLWRFCIRAVLHYVFLTPKSETFPFLMPAAQTHVISILVPNTICILIHMLGGGLPLVPGDPSSSALPQQLRDDPHRGYLHGGVLVDFVGQRPPRTRFFLLALDLAVLALQCVMLAVHSDREQLRGRIGRFKPLQQPGRELGSGGGGPETGRGGGDAAAAEQGRAGGRSVADDVRARPPRPPPTSDMDGAEREGGDGAGLVREENDDGDHGNDQSGQGSAEQNQSAQEDSDRADVDDEADAQLGIAISSGLAILGEYNIGRTLQNASTDFEMAAAHSLRTLGYTANLTALAARRGSVPVVPARESAP